MITKPNAASSLSCPGCGAPASPTDAECAYCDRVLSSVACDQCFSRLFEGMKFCPHCGERNGAGANNSDSNALACPGCGDNHVTSVLSHRIVGSHTLHECLACHGIWLSSGVVDAITTDANARALFAPDGVQASPVSLSDRRATCAKSITAFRYRRCPECAKVMTRTNVAKISGVIVDRCSQHGTFFDIDELHALVRFLEQGGLDRARSREREALADERRRLQMLMDLDQRRRSMEYSRMEGVPDSSIVGLLTALVGRVAE